MENIKGQFKKIIYHRQDNGYTVAVFAVADDRDEESVVVNGYTGEVDKDKIYVLYGDYVDHPKYGIQFKIESFEKYIATDKNELVRYFSGPQFKGIGKKFAQYLVDELGEDIIAKIKHDPAVLDSLEKMNPKRKEAILNGMKTDEEEDYVFLTTHYLTMRNILKIKNIYKDETMMVLLNDPYRVIREVDGIGFATIDKFALSIGFEENNQSRLEAYSEEILMNLCMKNGDSYIDLQSFKNTLEDKFQCEVGDILDNLQMNRRIVIEETRVYPISQYNAETYIAGYLKHFPYVSMTKCDDEEIEENLQEVSAGLGITYQEKQLEAIEAFFHNDLLILTGGPGTGKTTIVRGMIELCKLIYPQYVVNLIAPTGRAAKRLAELTNSEAKTIHSLLLWDKETGRFAKNEDDPLSVDILIIDEFSMVDSYLFYNLLRACGSLKKLVIIGDVDQLPSVAMGAVLRDLIECGAFKTIQLEKIYRQKEGSDIITLANDIKKGNVDQIPVDKDIRFFECERSSIKDLTLQVVEYALNNYETLEEGFMNVQVLAPKHMGLNGINNLNVALQKRFNPPDPYKKEIKTGYRTFREYDKIIQLKNQPDDDVFNGDIGIIVEIVYASEDINHQGRIIANFDGRIVEYTSETFANITHAYCISVHKAQGSEYPIVILPMDLEYSIMLQKRLVYTAVTRAYKSLIFIGDKRAFYKGITTLDHYHRNTTLKQRILEDDY